MISVPFYGIERPLSRIVDSHADAYAEMLYEGASGVMSDLVGNHVGAMFVPTHVAPPLAADRQNRILGVATPERVRAGKSRKTSAKADRADHRHRARRARGSCADT